LDTHDALLIYDYVYKVHGKDVFSRQSELQFIEALGEAGRYQDLNQKSLEFDIREHEPLQVELLNIQRIRREASSHDRWLEALNELYKSIGLDPIRLTTEKEVPLLDRLTTGSTHIIDGPRVSVIMPTYS